MPVSTDMMDGGVVLVTLSPEASADTFAPANFEPLLSTLKEINGIDLTVDGADEFDKI